MFYNPNAAQDLLNLASPYVFELKSEAQVQEHFVQTCVSQNCVRRPSEVARGSSSSTDFCARGGENILLVYDARCRHSIPICQAFFAAAENAHSMRCRTRFFRLELQAVKASWMLDVLRCSTLPACLVSAGRQNPFVHTLTSADPAHFLHAALSA